MSYNTGVYHEQGGTTLVVTSTGVIDIKTGGKFYTNGAQGAALTAGLTTITHTAAGTPDYAIQNLTNSSPYGFVTADEGNTVLAVIANLQTKVAEIEARLEAIGLIAAN